MLMGLAAALAISFGGVIPAQAATRESCHVDCGAKASPRAQQRMTIPMAKHYISEQLKYKYGHVWKDGVRKTWRRCRNVSAIRVRCNLYWVSGQWIYYGPVYAYYRVQDRQHVYIGIAGIRRTRY